MKLPLQMRAVVRDSKFLSAGPRKFERPGQFFPSRNPCPQGPPSTCSGNNSEGPAAQTAVSIAGKPVTIRVVLALKMPGCT